MSCLPCGCDHLCHCSASGSPMVTKSHGWSVITAKRFFRRTAVDGERHAWLIGEAAGFVEAFHREFPGERRAERLSEIRDEIELTGSYTHTGEELAYGAKVAWRNSSRCIGRLYWRSLQVRDLRRVTGAKEVAA